MNNITINIGKDSKGNSIERELESILVCGCTHSGKSVFLNNVINTILKKKSPQDVKLILVDTKSRV
ncbi:MAG TPA: FtsK/SpoIIIE domain-containing protein [Candidatus Dojkabacteria bacterium]|nr:FtsK/SpoIIIE domain-containing protein [Candidatus Dojkabacteria bacterium]